MADACAFIKPKPHQSISFISPSLKMLTSILASLAFQESTFGFYDHWIKSGI
jgi:hypothetical protein